MKKVILSFTAVCFILTGCASTITNPDTVNPIGIVSIMSNSQIGWYGEEKEEASLLGSILNNVVNEKQDEGLSTLLSRADILIGEAEGILRNTLADSGKVSVLDKNTVLDSDAYKLAEMSTLFSISDFIYPEGYSPVDYKDKNLAKNLYKELGATSSLYVDFTFNKKVIFGVEQNGKLGAFVAMSVKIVNSKGKVIFQKSYRAQSEDSTAVVGGIYDPQKLLDLFPETVQEVCDSFIEAFDY